MKDVATRISIGIIGVCFLTMLLACSPKSSSKVSETDAVIIQKSENVELKDFGVVLFNNAAVYEEKDGGMVYKSTVQIANIVKWKNQVKKAIRKSDSQEREFAQIAIDKETLWIQTPFIAPQAIPGVVVGDETGLYKKADAATFSGRTIAKLTMIAVHPDSESGNFIAISAYVDGNKAPVITRQFVKKENIDTDSGDVRGIQLFTIAMEAKDPVVRKELLKNALETNTRFSDLVQDELDNLNNASNAADPASVAFSKIFIVNDDNVNVRDRPDQASGKVVTQLFRDTSVTATDKTTENFTIDGVTAPWYKLEEPKGWVFGSFLVE